MKNIYSKLLPLIMLFPCVANAQWTTSGSNIYNSNTGNIGIGTTSPRAALDMAKFIENGALGTVLGRLPEGDSQGSGTFLGTQGYETQLSGYGGKSFSLIHSFYGQINNSINFFRGGGMVGGSMSFNTNSNIERMRIDDQGNIGIGTSTPSGKLHINASLTDAAIKIGTPNTPGNLNVPMGASTGGYNIDFYTWRDVQPDQIGARIRAERWNTHSNNNALIQSMDLAFYTSVGLDQTNLTEKMRISSSGNVSIGTKDSKGYKFAVAGNMIATEIKVQASPWPDFVFSKDYKLPTLESVEKHIQKEGYLPNMPSAQEVKTNGINVGEMNAKLLQKIEELTLYILEQNKRIEKLESKKEKSN